MDEGHLVHVPGHVRKDVRDTGPALAMALAAGGRFHDGPELIAEETGVAIEASQLLPVAALQCLLVIPGVHLARAAVHEEPYDGAHARREMRSPRRQRMARIGPRLSEQILLVQEAGEGHGAEATADALEEVAP